MEPLAAETKDWFPAFAADPTGSKVLYGVARSSSYESTFDLMNLSRWTAVSQSPFAWEREALNFARSHLPDHEPWRAWANFEFIDDEGRVNEVDLLVLTPAGLVLIEIKSRPGTVTGDAHSWSWITEGREF